MVKGNVANNDPVYLLISWSPVMIVDGCCYLGTVVVAGALGDMLTICCRLSIV